MIYLLNICSYNTTVTAIWMYINHYLSEPCVSFPSDFLSSICLPIRCQVWSIQEEKAPQPLAYYLYR